jgi:hypothetical protein
MERYRGVRDWNEIVTEIKLRELEGVINVGNGDGLEFVENVKYLCCNGEYVIR